jgi:hypothetical protein
MRSKLALIGFMKTKQRLVWEKISKEDTD